MPPSKMSAHTNRAARIFTFRFVLFLDTDVAGHGSVGAVIDQGQTSRYWLDSFTRLAPLTGCFLGFGLPTDRCRREQQP